MKKLPSLFNYNTELIKTICVVLIVSSIYFFFVSKLNIFSIAELKSQDIMIRLSRLIKPAPAHTDEIVVIAVDDESFNLLNQKWPWPRPMFAYLVDRLSIDHPKVISIDFSFVGESERKQDDALLCESFSDANNVLTASYFTADGKYVKPLKEISDSSLGFGFINKPRDEDLLVRRSRLMLYSEEDKRLDYSLALKTFAVAKGVSLKDIKYNGKNIIIKDASIPVDKQGALPIDFRLKSREFTTVPFWKVLDTALPAPGTFKDKIILVGPTNEILHDIHNTPLGLMPGIIINANELLMLLNKSFIIYLPRWLEFIILCVFVLAVSILTYRARAPRILFKVVGAIIIFWEIGLLLSLKNIRLDYFSPAFLMIASHLGVSTYKYFNLIVQNVALKTQAITDELTGLFSYRYFILRLHNELERAKRFNFNLSLVMMDIDHFKKINDTHGHETGNVILKEIGEILETNTRKADVAFRFGGEELCVILTHTSSEGAHSYGEKIRQLIERFSFAKNKSIKVTISAGVSCFPKDKVYSAKEFINAADVALYHAKRSGRNRVVVFEPALVSGTETTSP